MAAAPHRDPAFIVMTMTGRRIQLVWDLRLEAPTLGGALVLRQEGEWLADQANREEIEVHVIRPADRKWPQRLIQTVFLSSAYAFVFTEDPADPDAWPPLAQRRSGFSYFSLSRLVAEYSDSGYKPRLRWNEEVERAAIAEKKRYPGRLVALHLRQSSPYRPEESNAVGGAWKQALDRWAHEGETDFLLLGDDRIPPDFYLRPGICRAVDRQLDLSVQLALVAHCDAFLGMASGIGMPANFCATPHIIFKHPAHHAAQMRAELGDLDRFPFAEEKQRLWRREATAETIDEALNYLLK